jgi:hypothetical protein
MDLAQHCIVKPGSKLRLKKLIVQALDHMKLKYPAPTVDVSKVVLD